MCEPLRNPALLMHESGRQSRGTARNDIHDLTIPPTHGSEKLVNQRYDINTNDVISATCMQQQGRKYVPS